MQPITKKMVKAVSVSSVALALISVLISVGFIFFVLALIGWTDWNSFFKLLGVTLLGISAYYLSFGVFSRVFAVQVRGPAK